MQPSSRAFFFKNGPFSIQACLFVGITGVLARHHKMKSKEMAGKKNGTDRAACVYYPTPVLSASTPQQRLDAHLDGIGTRRRRRTVARVILGILGVRIIRAPSQTQMCSTAQR